MKVRGERECQDCGTRWSYYETGSVACPGCESLRSVGVDERTVHTDAPATIDLTVHRERFGDARGTLPEEGVDDLKTDLREYVRKRGFVRGGELLAIDATYLAARELLEAVDAYNRLRDPTDADREYLLALLAGADAGERPAADAVPESMREARGMAAVHAVEAYREDLLAFRDELAAGRSTADDEPTVSVETNSPEAADVEDRIEATGDPLEELRDRATRVEALQGDVDPAVADALVDAANAIGEYVRTGADATLERANARLADASL